jgi:hypothetical protein
MNALFTDDIEEILDCIRKNCVILTDYHRIKYFKLLECVKYYRIPCIILSGVNSVLSVGLAKFVVQDAVSVANCLISLIVGIIGSIELFMNIQTKLNNELTNSKNYYVLATDIFKTLKLERENRHVEALSYLEQVYTEYIKYINEGNIRKDPINDNLFIIRKIDELVIDIPTRPTTPRSETSGISCLN